MHSTDELPKIKTAVNNDENFQIGKNSNSILQFHKNPIYSK